MRTSESSIECAYKEKIKNEKRKWTIESIGEELKQWIEERNKHRMCLIKERELFLNDEWMKEIDRVGGAERELKRLQRRNADCKEKASAIDRL